MDIEAERERLQEQCTRFSRYSAQVREAGSDPNHRALQCAQNFILVTLLTNTQNNVFRLLQTPEDAAPIGEDTLKTLYQYTEEYANLLELEYQWYINIPPEL